MESSTANQITTPGNQNFFLSPQFPMQRQYEALRAYLLEEEPSADVARRFGYSAGAFRVLCYQFRHDPQKRACFFRQPQRGPQSSPARDRVRDLAVAMRKRNLSVYDMQRVRAACHRRRDCVCAWPPPNHGPDRGREKIAVRVAAGGRSRRVSEGRGGTDNTGRGRRRRNSRSGGRRRRRAPLRGGKHGGLRTGAAWGTEGRGRSSGCQVSLSDSQCWTPYLDGATETWNSQYVWRGKRLPSTKHQ